MTLSRKRAPRGGISAEDVRAVLGAAEVRAARGVLEHHAPVGLRLAAVTGARRGELAALRWEELDGDRLTVDSSIAIIRAGGDRHPELRDDPTKTANRRVVRLDGATCAQLEGLRTAFAEYGPWILSVGERPLGPERLSAWCDAHVTTPASMPAGGSTTSGTGQQRSPSPPATTSGASRAASATPTPR